MFDKRDPKTSMAAELSYEYSLKHGKSIRQLIARIYQLECMLKVEWSESNKKYYKIDDEDKKDA